MASAELSGLFPVPFLTVRGALPAELVQTLVTRMAAAAAQSNAKSLGLKHTTLGDPETDSAYGAVRDAVTPYLVEFGKVLFGERLDWTLKELWTNVMAPGGYQAMHSHSNSFISGVVYLNPTPESARTTFYRDMGAREFVFSNENARAETGPFNANRWVAPAGQPGDMILFPSYLLHEVPVNEGGERLSLAFNAIPDRLDSWGYRVRFSSEPAGR